MTMVATPRFNPGLATTTEAEHDPWASATQKHKPLVHLYILMLMYDDVY
jgi:hypothetical protein